MDNITISINLKTGSVDVDNTSVTGNTTNNKVESKSEPETFTVESKYLLYKLADAGLLESIVAVVYSDKLKRNVWVFEKTDDVSEICAKFFEERKVERQKRKAKKAERENKNDEN